MASRATRQGEGAVMQIVGILMVVGALIWLLVVEDPFPMWLIIAGVGVMFLGVGAAIRGNSS